MKNSLTRDNLKDYLIEFSKQNDINFTMIAKAIGCSKHTISRIVYAKTLPSDEMLKQIGILIAIGMDKYKKLSKAEKEKISENIGATGGGILGFGLISSAISASGTVSGLTAAGITSGLASMGSAIGGGMVAGVAIAAAIPVAMTIAGFGAAKGIKSIINNSKLNDEKFNEYWEIRK